MSNDVVKNWTYRDGLPEILLLFNPVDKSASSPCLILSCPCTTRYEAPIFFHLIEKGQCKIFLERRRERRGKEQNKK
jgi:hypothetical protein